jgi:hypothetical protein
MRPWPSPGAFRAIPRKIPAYTRYSRHILALLATNDAIVPEIWAFEIANSIFVSFNKRKRITEPQIEGYLRRLKEPPISVEGRGLWSNVDLETLSRRSRSEEYSSRSRNRSRELID